jgi:flagellar basal-body rod protein FlgC
MNVISSNLANANTTRTPEGGPYRRKEVLMAAYPAQRTFEDILNANLTDSVSEVKVVGVVNDTRPFITKYDPQHPDANENGYVLMPNVNIVKEMVDMMSATRNYEANVTAINASKSMALKALEIGR